MSDVNELLARLKMPSAADTSDAKEASPRSTSASALHHPQPQPVSLLHSFTASPAPARGHSLSPGQPDDRAASDRTANLLNLLKFNQPVPAATPTSQHAATVSTDLGASSSQNLGSPLHARDPSSSKQPQDALLALLNPSSAAPLTDLVSPPDIKENMDVAGSSVGQQEVIEDILAKQEASELEVLAKLVSEQEEQSLQDAKDAVQEVATELQEELKQPDSQLKESMPTPMADAFEETVDRVAHQAATTDNDTQASTAAARLADTSDSPIDQEPRVFQFPMRPFVAIQIHSAHEPARRVRDDLVIKIAALKRDFDQVDRTLAASTSNFIVYAMLSSKGGGIRLIRQDEGTFNHIFKKSGASMFNVAIASPKGSGGPDVILATDTNGSVYWTSASASEDPDKFSEHNFESKSFIFPPLPSQDDNTSGAQLKTRAKLSSRHPEFFAVGRGKSIHIIRPNIAMSIDAPYINPLTRLVDSEKYLSEQCLKIATGKAGKDFTFSEDDTLIVSLDKAGRLKFWDIRPQTDSKTAVFKSRSSQHIETRNPLMTLATCAPNEKSWATSVHFVDKERPMAKGLALRYMIVGSKQNHTLHLWDLGLGKPVQEVNFPHENEMDAICSVIYHPRTGILTVGHPTRNSVYLIHVSAPRYNLPTGVTQAEFVRRLSEKDPTLPVPESTAIMSGMREISLSSIGQLRSLSVLSVPMSLASSEEVESVLELYIMHSKGLTSLTLTRQDIGIGMDGKPLYPTDAEEAGRIAVSDLKSPPAIEIPQLSSEASSRSEIESKKDSKDASSDGTKGYPSPKPKQQSSKGNMSPSIRPLVNPELQTLQEDTATASGSFVEILQREPTDQSRSITGSQESASFIPAADVSRSPEKPAFEATPAATPEIQKRSIDIMSSKVQDAIGDDALKLGQAISGSVSSSLSEGFAKLLADQLGSLHRRIDEDKRVQEAASSAKQDAILRLVSSTLTENVEQSLTRIITTNIRESVVPSISGEIKTVIESRVSDVLGHYLETNLPQEIKTALPNAITKSMDDPKFMRKISDMVSTKVAERVEQVFSTALQSSIAPTFKQLSEDAAQQTARQLQARVADQLRQFDEQNSNFSAKIDQLAALNYELLDTVKTMASSQSLLRQEISELRAEVKNPSETPTPSSRTGGVTDPPAAERDAEVDEIAALMTTGRYADGTIKWLQSARQAEIFDKLFVQMNPSYLRSCNQIVVLSVSAAVTATLHSNLAERLSWLEVALSIIDPQNGEIAGHVSGVMNHLTQRLQDCYMSIAETASSNPILPKIHALVRQAKELKTTVDR